MQLQDNIPLRYQSHSSSAVMYIAIQMGREKYNRNSTEKEARLLFSSLLQYTPKELFEIGKKYCVD